MDGEPVDVRVPRRPRRVKHSRLGVALRFLHGIPLGTLEGRKHLVNTDAQRVEERGRSTQSQQRVGREAPSSPNRLFIRVRGLQFVGDSSILPAIFPTEACNISWWAFVRCVSKCSIE